MILKAMAMALACTTALASDAWAQTPEPGAGDAPAATESPATAGAAEIRIPAKTPVEIEISEELSSKTRGIGDTFALKLAAPLILEGRTILPAGLAGRGEVTQAARSGNVGKAGELIVNARYLECGALHIPLGYFQQSIAGKDRTSTATMAGFIVPFGQLLVSGDDAVIPAGTHGTARVKAEVVMSAESVGRCASPVK